MGVTPAKRTLTIDDCLAVPSVGDVQISPDGKRIAFVVADTWKEHDEPPQGRVWLVSADANAKDSAHSRRARGPTRPPGGHPMERACCF